MTSAAVLPMPDGRVHLAVLSQTAVSTFRRCAREFELCYVKKRRPRKTDDARRFGSLFHVGLNAWWNADLIARKHGVGPADPLFRLGEAFAAIAKFVDDQPESADPFDLVKAEELLLGYTARWGDEEYETIAVEQQFDVPLVNPATGHASKTYRVQGALDLLCRHVSDVRLIHGEHKTTSKDITPGSDYWRKVSTLDGQVSTYQSALRALGHTDVDTMYDVIRKVDLRPSKATPEESRKYTQRKTKACPFCKKKGGTAGPHRVSAEGEPEAFCEDGEIVTDPGGVLYKGQREFDETPEEYRERVRAHIAENPERYFARGPIVRLERDEEEHARDIWQTATMIRLSENAGAFPRSPNACERFGRLCDYFDVCSGIASIDDETRFRTAEHAHEELVPKEV